MARPLRIDVEDGWYHVVSRGIEKRTIFLDDTFRLHFLDLLGEMTDRFGVEVHAYVLMNYHYHLVMRTPGANARQAMQWLRVLREHRWSSYRAYGNYAASPEWLVTRELLDRAGGSERYRRLVQSVSPEQPARTFLTYRVPFGKIVSVVEAVKKAHEQCQNELSIVET